MDVTKDDLNQLLKVLRILYKSCRVLTTSAYYVKDGDVITADKIQKAVDTIDDMFFQIELFATVHNLGKYEQIKEKHL